jgi:hypothetical protein
MKWARALVVLMSVECFAVSLGFMSSGGWKLAVYWFCLSIVNGVASTF